MDSFPVLHPPRRANVGQSESMVVGVRFRFHRCGTKVVCHDVQTNEVLTQLVHRSPLSELVDPRFLRRLVTLTNLNLLLVLLQAGVRSRVLNSTNFESRVHFFQVRGCDFPTSLISLLRWLCINIYIWKT